MAVSTRSWPIHRDWNLYQSDAASLSAEFAREAEDLFTQDEDLDVTIIVKKDGFADNMFKWVDAGQISQYIQVAILKPHLMPVCA